VLANGSFPRLCGYANIRTASCRLIVSMENMRQIIAAVVQVFRDNPNLADNDILKRVIDSGVENSLAVQAVALLPIAYGRVMLSDEQVRFSGTYVCLGEDGKNQRTGRLSSLPVWAEAIDFARHDGNSFLPIASRSSEMRVCNEALKNGKKLANLVCSPPVFLWPVDSLSKSSRPWWQFRKV
jgi:hypothetical protein